MKIEFTAADVKERLSQYKPDIVPSPEHLKPASVLMPFYENENGLSLIFMMRPDYPGVHGAQISFPGGQKDTEDEDELGAALRETEEEIGVNRYDIEVWGGLSTQQTMSSKYWITPFVGQIPYPYTFNPDQTEVERLIIIPFSHILNPKNYSYGDFDFRGYTFPSHMYTFGEDVIWGLTARILKSFISFLRTGQELH
ncbi:MAG: CoA pyrophosphatase [Deltaproteobacteria bacterium]|jgi:8-oxo-dGTP pyrophosphatase MutT (NUDIX family)|nr:CoA pyrophosphatase [Deltaproteobacteria bacterium]MBT4268721.1 CoA pyrophosphatase [Deltaproteobacteria bacterium]MBT4638395.1 CoA pyrophosphatase [Deltaproteobacteria bacterium]MBT6500239.1 CoA pyrophosphatase [Deltaproteobacteria bacterium]MBT6613939.1 CoA pyrophosphatase [Deltaproteobacteria bacterium]